MSYIVHPVSNWSHWRIQTSMFTCLNTLLPPSLPPLSYTQTQTVASGKYNRALCETLLVVRLVVDSSVTAADWIRGFPFESQQNYGINQHVFCGLFGSSMNISGQYVEFGHDCFLYQSFAFVIQRHLTFHVTYFV